MFALNKYFWPTHPNLHQAPCQNRGTRECSALQKLRSGWDLPWTEYQRNENQTPQAGNVKATCPNVCQRLDGETLSVQWGVGYSWVWSLCCPDLKIPPSFTNFFAASCGETPQEAVPRMPFAENSPSSPFLFSPFFLLLKSVVIFVCLPLFLLPLFPLFFGFFFF